jgi:hypothetical protein
VASWKDLANVVKKAAPLLGTALSLTGPPGQLASNFISSALGTDPDNPEEALALIEKDPEALLKLKKIESENRVRLQELSLAETQSYLDDRQNARKREVEIIKSTGRADKNTIYLAWFVVFGFFFALGTLLFVELAEGMTNIIYMMLGTLGAKFGDIISYYFGSNKSSNQSPENILGGKR